MNPDDFEQRLQRQPLRQMPVDWRHEILSAAQGASVQPESLRGAHQVPRWRSILSTLNSQLSTLLWPSPAAWAGLAAIWLVILVVNSSTTSKSKDFAREIPRAVPEVIETWKEQERLLTELIGPPDIPVADRPKPVAPRPRSERQNGASRV